MGKILIATLFVLMMALNIVAYFVFVDGINGSTVSTKHSAPQSERRLAR